MGLRLRVYFYFAVGERIKELLKAQLNYSLIILQVKTLINID